MIRRIDSRRTIAMLVLTAYLPAVTGCTGWITQQQGVVATIAAHPELQRIDTATSVGFNGKPDTTVNGRKMRVTSTSGMVELQGVRISNDSLVGRLSNNAPEAGIPLSTIATVELRGVSTGKTLGLFAGIGAGIAVAALVTVAAADAALCSLGEC